MELVHYEPSLLRLSCRVPRTGSRTTPEPPFSVECPRTVHLQATSTIRSKGLPARYALHVVVRQRLRQGEEQSFCCRCQALKSSLNTRLAPIVPPLPRAHSFFSSSFSAFFSSAAGNPLSTDWMRGSLGSTPGSELSTDCKKLASWNIAADAAGGGAAAGGSGSCDIVMASASCIASSSSSSPAASAISTSAGVVGAGGLGAAGCAGAAGVTGGGAAAGVFIAAAESAGIDMAIAASSSAASSSSPPAAGAASPIALSSLEASAAPAASAAAALSPSARFFASASWRARSSSIETRRAHANSGSIVGSTPNSAKPSAAGPPPPPIAIAPPPIPPPSPWTMGELRRMSESTCGPGGTVIR
mmetsp:Transcript_43002/g.107014  ORF Transcript_43002/g.107014 Transcript_43002/m.107014 type:complete len:359 (-) Transcript_43002:523-1599(-)